MGCGRLPRRSGLRHLSRRPGVRTFGVRTSSAASSTGHLPRPSGARDICPGSPGARALARPCLKRREKKGPGWAKPGFAHRLGVLPQPCVDATSARAHSPSRETGTLVPTLVTACGDLQAAAAEPLVLSVFLVRLPA